TGGDITVVDTGRELPSATPVTLPASGSTKVDTTFEHLEGMVVEFTDTMVVSEYFELARAGHLVLTPEARPYQFTHTNAPDADGYANFLADLDTRRIYL